MRNLNLDGDEPSSDIFYDPYTQTDARLKEGDKFRSKEECIMAIKRFHMANNVDFKVDRGNVERKRSDSWVIGSISQDHTCVNTNVSQDHRKLSYDIICQEILPQVDKDPSVKVKTIISHIVATYNYTPSYRKAWLEKTKAIELVYGNWEDSNKQLPRFLSAFQIYAPGTVTILETLPAQSPDGTCLQGNVIFHRLFWAFRSCVQGFAYCKPILQIDDTWLYGKYKGTLLMAVAQDGNSNIFPVAFTLVEGETARGWGFLLRNLQIHVAPQPGLCLISDRNASIESTYNNPTNGWQNPPSTHVYCIRHIAQNFMREIRDKVLRKTLVNAGYALTQPTFQYYRHEIVSSNPDAGRWIDNLAKEKWTRSYDNGQRWGHMTTNLVESMNRVFKGIRHLPITALVQATYYRMAFLFARRGERWSAVLESGQVFSETCVKFMKEQSAKANSHNVTSFDRFNRTFNVKEIIDHNEGLPRQQYRVLIDEGWCDCRKFQAFRMPCSHVIAACSYAHQDPLALLSPIYKAETLLGVYNNAFQVMAKEDYWPAYEGDVVWHNDNMRRKKRGRPNSTRIRTEMDDHEKMVRKCGICREIGHNKNTCPNRGATSTNN
ncbi:uncharacterized protein LOC131650445 [Vicia villosa]|uniref:uncharacterized protein LOC131650445 n=1 Tax=Vicia villosa TaxID=3911 RepID=UPI00273BF26A|nr:uncharacterized protein LOC131650445 [Vicia villosa]